ncbi:ATP-dependent nuclease [Neisseria sp. P0016.S002]|jgi:hypothetical protein
MKLNMTIKHIKSIDELKISLPVEKGLYAITGQNGSGKSTVITCASSAYFNMKMNEYFGKTPDDASISFELNGSTRIWEKENRKWNVKYDPTFKLSGFYEGSIIFGNRFRNTSFNLLMKIDRVDFSKLKPTNDFLRENLGKILHNNKNFYDKILRLDSKDADNLIKFNGDVFFYQKGDKRVSQFHMSTGENLLLSILNSIDRRNKTRRDDITPCLLLLDEIELALHPSSLKRLIEFLKKISNDYNYAVYFSTHSIELISNIAPKNIFFLERHTDNSIEILNPCYPAYATRILYDHEGYDYIILVEDDLAREIIRKLLKEHSLINNKLIHILPCGGFTNTIDLAQEVISSNLMGKLSKISIILDRDIKEQAEKYIKKNDIIQNIPLNYLPIESLEKFLKSKLINNVDHSLFRELNDFVFHQKSLTNLIEEYKDNCNINNDNNGKKFYEIIETELEARGRTRQEIIEIILKYLSKNEEKYFSSLIDFLKKNLQNF